MARFVVLGDPHITSEEMPLWEEAIDDINALEPQAVLVLGDLTGGADTGAPQGLQRAVAVLNRLKAPWHTIIGNHDLQCTQLNTDEAAVASFLEQVGRSTPWFSEMIGPVAVIGLSNTQWRKNPGTPHEIVINEPQLAWWREELQRLADHPVLMLGHAPPVGSGLLTLTELHCQVGNAFINQNHFSNQIQKTIHEHPNILFWFSGHNHMGQHYRDAITLRQGVHYIHTGVVSRRNSRDGQRHSRVLEIDEGGIRVRTFDHARRRFDETLEHHEPYGLADFLDYRRAMLAKRLVPRDPSTMRQGPGQARSSKAVRFAFVSDAHVVVPVNPVQQRLIDWALQQIKGQAADRIILGGDLTHHADPAEVNEFLNQFAPGSLPIDYLPGNNEGAGLEVDRAAHSNVHPITGCQAGGEGWPPRVFLLQTTNPDDAAVSVGQLAAQWPATGNVLILAHFPPDAAAEALAAAHPEQQIWWICGHKHVTQTTTEGNLHVLICGGLDPVKVRGQLPAILMIDWDGDTASVQTLHPPEDLLYPIRSQPHPVGMACRDSAEGMIRTALEAGIDCLQFHYSLSHGRPSEADLSAIAHFRQNFNRGFLSLHLPGFSDEPAGPVSPDLAAALQWAREAKVDDLTIHLPAVPVERLFDARQQWLDTPWTRACQEAYLALAEQTLEFGAQLSLENLYNKQPLPPMQEKLSSRPWHLIQFVRRLREALEKRGYSPEKTQRIGIIFDTGHAFRDASVAKIHGLADWIHQIGPYLQLAHIHQVGLSPEGKPTNHRPILNRLGPRINYTGVIAAIEEAARRPVPLLIEVRDKVEALASWQTLNPKPA